MKLETTLKPRKYKGKGTIGCPHFSSHAKLLGQRGEKKKCGGECLRQTDIDYWQPLPETHECPTKGINVLHGTVFDQSIT